MLAYWILFFIPAFLTLSIKNIPRQKQLVLWVMAGIFITLFIGFRYQVGGDWYNYNVHFKLIAKSTLENAFTLTDPAYAYINWQMAQWGYDIYAVNLVCAAIFTLGLLVFAYRQPYGWIALVVAVPYIITVVAMGYTRQGVALGLIFMALVNLERGRFSFYIIYIIIATLFHSTALVMIPLGLFLYSRTWLLRAIAILILGYWFWDLLLADKQEFLWESYITADMQSQGARIRVYMNLIPGLIFLIYWKQWKKIFPNYGFWLVIAIGTVVSVVLVEFASTAVDRVALYLIPIQVAVFSRLPYLTFGRIDPGAIKTGIIFGYAAVHFTWLNYAFHAKYWVPYQNLLFQ